MPTGSGDGAISNLLSGAGSAAKNPFRSAASLEAAHAEIVWLALISLPDSDLTESLIRKHLDQDTDGQVSPALFSGYHFIGKPRPFHSNPPLIGR